MLIMVLADCYLNGKLFNGDAWEISVELPAECNRLLECCGIFASPKLEVGFPLLEWLLL